MLKNMISSKDNSTLDIERLIIYTIVLLTIIVFIIQADSSIIMIVPFTIVYFFVVINYLVIPFLKNKNLEGMLIRNVPSGYESFKRISKKHYSYNNEVLYILNEYEQKVTAIPFSDITAVTRTTVKIKNRRFWKIVALYEGNEVAFKFRHNYSLGNNNFPNFLKSLKHVNPTAAISKWNIWNV